MSVDEKVLKEFQARVTDAYRVRWALKAFADLNDSEVIIKLEKAENELSILKAEALILNVDMPSDFTPKKRTLP